MPSKMGTHQTKFKIQRSLLVELPGLGKPGALERRSYPPGQHGQIRRKFSEYGLRLREKQKLRFHFGMREEQLRRFVKAAKKKSHGNWIDHLISTLESRLDNVVFRLGFAPSMAASKQLVRHGHVLVNGKKATISSMILKPGDQIEMTEAAVRMPLVQWSIKQPRLELADFLDRDASESKATGKLKYRPDGDALPFPFTKSLVAEHYSGV
jgi:small subunit ribosomal protein S4